MAPDATTPADSYRCDGRRTLRGSDRPLTPPTTFGRLLR